MDTTEVADDKRRSALIIDLNPSAPTRVMNESPLILSLETATLGGSVFLGRGKQELATRIGDPLVSQSNSLLSDIDETLKAASLSLSEVELFACASGPGSFTGLRIGIATLKGLAATLKRPCVGIPSLQAVAHAAGPSSQTVALLPAGRGEVFAQMFSVSEKDEVVALDTGAHLSPQALVKKYGVYSQLTWAGNGAHVQRDFLKSHAQLLENVFAEDPEPPVDHRQAAQRKIWYLARPQVNLAQHVAILAVEAFKEMRTQSPGDLSAIYVRPSDAEMNQQCR